jgi:NADPH:quinone reductase-like Zn-dependent oxidoreductase
MKAYKLAKPGIDHPLELIEIDVPNPGDNEVLIKTEAISINPVDIKTRNGAGVYSRIKNDSPVILGWDISGKVVGTGNGVSDFAIGDDVFGMVHFPGHGKAYAEYVIAPIAHLAKIPENVSHSEAAASTLAALTAYQVFARHIKKGDRVFIQSAAGGVGHFAVQIARILGAYTIGTASQENEAFLNSIGLDEFINYRTNDFSQTVKDVDFALDTMGGDILARTFSIVRRGGRIVTLPSGNMPDMKALEEKTGVSIGFELVESNGRDMEQIAEWLSDEKLIPHIHQEFSFAEIEKAHQQMNSGRTRGKNVIRLS